MTSEVYGYLIANEPLNHTELCADIEIKTNIGIAPILQSALYDFPEELLPSSTDNPFCFVIGDKPGTTMATLLLFYIDFAPEADIDIDISRIKRLELLVNAIKSIISMTKATRFVIALTDSCQIEEAKSINLKDLRETLIRDLEKYSPPDCIYDVIID